MPALLPGANWFVAAFWELSTDRQLGFSTGPIPAASIDRWTAKLGLDAEEAEMARRAIRAMDEAYLAFARLPPKRRNMLSNSGVAITPALFDALIPGKK